MYQRQILDEVKNTHGEVFLDFLLEANICIPNGRITLQFDNYTSVSVKGKSVVDYCAVPHRNWGLCKSFKIHLAREAMTRAGSTITDPQITPF